MDRSQALNRRQAFRLLAGGGAGAAALKTMAGGADWSPYQGWSLAGFAETTFCRGRKIVDNYQFIGENGYGQWLPRERAGALPRAKKERRVRKSETIVV